MYDNQFLNDFFESLSGDYCLLSRWHYNPNYPITQTETHWNIEECIHRELFHAGAVDEDPSTHPWTQCYK